jgi:hypothetical protein
VVAVGVLVEEFLMVLPTQVVEAVVEQVMM